MFLRGLPFRSLNSCQFSSEPCLRPSFVVHPRAKLSNPKNQATGLTNSHETDQPPSEFLKYSENLDVIPWRRLVEKALVFEKQFQTRSENSDRHNGNHMSLMQNLVKVVLSQAPAHPHLKDLYVTGDYHVNGSWYCNDSRIDVRGRPGIIVKSKRPLRPFFPSGLPSDQQSSTDTTELSDADLFSSLTLRDIRSDQPDAVPIENLPYPYYHTLIRFSQSPDSHNYDVNRSLLYLHGIAAKQSSLSLNTDSHNTHCVQGIVTDGQQFSFLWYQYNGGAEGGDNVVAVVRQKSLYDGLSQTTLRKDYSSWKMSNYNDTVLQDFVSLFLWQHYY